MATTTKRRGGPRPSPNASGVYVPLTRRQMEQLDKERKSLGLSRGRYLATLFDRFGEDISSTLGTEQSKVEESRELLRREGASIVEACERAMETMSLWSRERHAIGVNLNQIARLANLLGMKTRMGVMPASTELKALGESLERISGQLDVLITTEATQDSALDTLRRFIDNLTTLKTPFHRRYYW